MDLDQMFHTIVSQGIEQAHQEKTYHPQPEPVLANTTVQLGTLHRAVIDYAEGHESWHVVEDQVVHLIAQLFRLLTEGDRVQGIVPPHTPPPGGRVDVKLLRKGIDEGRWVRWSPGNVESESLGRIKSWNRRTGTVHVVFRADGHLDQADFVNYTSESCEDANLRFISEKVAPYLLAQEGKAMP